MSFSNILSKFSKPSNDPQKQQIIENLLREIWGFASPHAVPKAKAASCLYHYENLLTNRQLLDEQNTSLHDSNTQSSDVIALVQYLKQNSQTSIADIRDYLKRSPPHWLLNPQSQEVLDSILNFCVRLWLFSRPDLSDSNGTLQEAVRKPFANFNRPPNAWLWLEFSEKTLRERGNFHFTYTSDISEHLTFASRSIIRVFCHASVMERYEMTDDGKLYPPGLLPEIRRTLNLLWPIEDVHTAKHVYHLEKQQEVDIEAGMGHEEKFDLRLYPFFGERLAKIQERLESAEHRRTNSRGLQIAIWGIVLTASFGLVSAITGVMQLEISRLEE
ncbi:MAG: hypothetical protein LQ342_004525 [Letrouitia transgressa]|nr:MAG: hypothetical protein LQ342_004525 [Letrouitia transgressa]